MNIPKSIFLSAIEHLEEYDSTITYNTIETGNKKRRIRLAIKNLEKYKNKIELEKSRQSFSRE